MPSNYFLGSPNQVQDTFESVYDVPLNETDYSSLSYRKGELSALTGVLAGSFVSGGERVSYDDARKEAELAGVGNLDFRQYDDGSVDRERLTYQIERQRELQEIERQLNRGAASSSSYLKGVGSWLGATASDPLEVAAMLVPVGRVATAPVRGATVIDRLAARGIMGIKEGVLSSAVVEPLYARGSLDSGDDYDIYDSFTNIAFSGIAGGTLGAAGGFIADSFRARRFGGIADALTPSEQAKLLNTAAAQLDTTGRLDVSDLMNSTYLKSTGYKFDDLVMDPNLRKTIDGPQGLLQINKMSDDVIQGRVFTDDPEFAVKYQDVVNEIQTLRAKIDEGFNPVQPEPNKYDRALIEPGRSPKFKEEAQDYGRYKQLMIDMSSTKDSRILKRLSREADELNSRHDGRLKEEYEKSVKFVSDQRAQFDAQQLRVEGLQSELSGLTDQLNQKKTLKRLEMENDATIKQRNATEEMLSSNNRFLEKLDREAHAITQESLTVKNIETLDDMSRQMDDILSSFKDEYARYVERTGVELDVEEVEIDVATVKSATREVAECMVKNGF